MQHDKRHKTDCLTRDTKGKKVLWTGNLMKMLKETDRS